MLCDLEFYTYVYLDPLTLVPFYVGKGKGYRAHKHFHQTHSRPVAMKLRQLANTGHRPKIEIYPAISERHALDVEIELIAAFGRRDLGTGTLFNVSSGGETTAGFTGRKHSEESKAKISAAGKGRVISQETREKLREAGLKRDVSHLQSASSKEKRKLVCSSKDYQNKQSEAQKRISDPVRMRNLSMLAREKVLGRKESQETKDKKRKAMLGRVLSQETRAKISAARRLRGNTK